MTTFQNDFSLIRQYVYRRAVNLMPFHRFLLNYKFMHFKATNISF